MPPPPSPSAVPPRASVPAPRAAAVLALAALAGGCGGRLAYRSDEAHRTRFAVPEGVHTLRYSSPWGAVTFYAGEPGTVLATTVTRRAADTEPGLAALHEVDVELQQVPAEAGVLSVRAAEVPAGLDAAQHKIITKAVVEVPPGLAIEAHTGFGAMAAQGRRAGVALDTGHGPIMLKDCHGDARVRTGGGPVIVDAHRGGLDAESVKCPTIQAFVDEIGAQGVRLVTTIGSIQLHLPAEAAFELDARTADGKVLDSFDVPAGPLPGEERGMLMSGTVHGGGPPVRIEVRREGNIGVRARSE